MKKYEIEQGSPAWESLRCGIPTCSEFSNIITPAKGEFSAGARKYAYKLVAEIILKRPVMTISTPWMERGKIMEAEAIKAYEYINEVQVKKVGFVTDDHHRYGGSPDGVVGENGLMETKCLSEVTHVEFLVQNKIDPSHWPQVQGLLFVTGREWVDYFAYCPGLPSISIRTTRDEKYISKLAAHMETFRNMMGEMLLDLQRRGLYETGYQPETGEIITAAG